MDGKTDGPRIYLRRPNTLFPILHHGDRIYGSPIRLGDLGITGLAWVWNTITLKGAWDVLVSNDNACTQLQTSDTVPPGDWHSILSELLPAPVTPTDLAAEDGWINVSRCHAAYIRLDFIVDPAAALPGTELLTVRVNAVGE